MEASILDGSPFNLSLYTLSLIKTSISFWELPEIKVARRNYFSHNNVQWWKLETYHEITEIVLSLVDSSAMVESMMVELKDAVVSIGLKIFDWTFFVYTKLGVDVSYAEDIVWTPLGLVDKIKTFQLVWANDASLYEGYPGGPIYQIACVFAQENFIEQNEEQMMEELKKLPMKANADDYSNKIYGIITTFLCYYFIDFLKRDQRVKYVINSEADYLEFYGDTDIISDSELYMELSNYSLLKNDDVDDLEMALKQGTVVPPEVMVKLCVAFGLKDAFLYYYKDLNASRRKSVKREICPHCDTLCRPVFRVSPHYMIGELRQILLNARYLESPQAESTYPLSWFHFTNLLYFFPLESIIRSKLAALMSSMQLNNDLDEFLGYTFQFIAEDRNSQSPIEQRKVYQIVLSEIWKKTCSSKIDADKKLFIKTCIEEYAGMGDLTSLKKVLRSIECDTNDLYEYYQLAYQHIAGLNPFYRLDPSQILLVIQKRFFNEMMDNFEYRNKLLKEDLYKCSHFRKGEFRLWEERFCYLDTSRTSVREFFDPIECVYELAKNDRFDLCEKFIRYWHESPEDQAHLKKNFALSIYSSECVYEFWLCSDHNIYDVAIMKMMSGEFLEWIFDSQDDRIKFKKEKLSVLDLLHRSFTKVKTEYSENKWHIIAPHFINFCEMPPEKISNLKEELKLKMEDIILVHASVRNISVFDFLKSYVSMTDEDFKIIIQKLYDSSKLFELCQDALNDCYGHEANGLTVFYNIWLKLSGKISDIKCDLISLYAGQRSETFLTKLCGMYEKLEGGVILRKDDLIFDGEDSVVPEDVMSDESDDED